MKAQRHESARSNARSAQNALRTSSRAPAQTVAANWCAGQGGPRLLSLSTLSQLKEYSILKVAKVRPNHSLNRTFCGSRLLGFISFSPNNRPPQNAG